MQTHPSRTRILVALSIAAGLSGCMTAPKPIDAALAAKIKRTDVISVAGGEFNRRYTGLTVFNNDEETINVPDWGLDKAYEAQLAEVIKAGRDIAVVQAPYKRELFAKANELNGGWEGGYAWKDIESAVQAHCAANSLDALFVLTRRWSGDFLAGTNQSFNGVGMYARGGLGATRTYLHVVATLALLDCQTGKPIETRQVARRQEGLPGEISSSIPYRQIAFNKSQMPISTWTESELDDMRKALLVLPGFTWATTVNSILPR